MKKGSVLLIGLVLVLLVMAGCGGVTTTSATITSTNTVTSTVTTATENFPLTLTDQLGRMVTVNKVPERIVSLSPSNTEILFALGLRDKVVGVTDYCDYPPEAKNIASTGDYSTPNIEQIIALSPDLILADSIQEYYGIIPELEKYNLTVFGLDPKNLNDVLVSIALVGEITGATEAATELVSQMQNQIDKISGKIKDLTADQKPGVYYVVWHDPIMVAGSETLEHEFIRLAGGINLGGSNGSYYDLTLEAIIEANPDVIIVSSDMATDATLKYVLAESRLAGTSALQNNRVLGVDTNLSGRPGPRIVQGLLEFAKCMHPELFAD